MSDFSIPDLDKVVKVDGLFKSAEIKRLTAPGENYLSLVLQVDIEVEKNGAKTIVNAVAKRVPPVKSKMGDMQIVSMKNEIHFYSEIIPLLTEFSDEYGVDSSHLYAKYYGSRLSLDPSQTTPDNEATLLVENLNPFGFKNEDRHVGFDLTSTKSVLKSLALFHVIPIALRAKKPEDFKILKDHLINSLPSSDGPPGEKPPLKPDIPEDKMPDKLLFKAMQNIDECKPYIEQIRPAMEKSTGPGPFMGKPGTEPWATIGHNDLWVNNMMIKPIPDQEPIIKFVDFQVCGYKSFASDLVFFLLTSVQNQIQKEHLDDLLRYYYQEFTENLRRFELDLELTYDDYLKEVEIAAREGEIKHVLFFTTPIFADKDSAVDVQTQELDMFAHMVNMVENMSQRQKDKLAVIIPIVCERKWI